MANPKNKSPHLAQIPDCPACAEDATKYNHCVWCGKYLGSHAGLIDHWAKTGCGAALLRWLRAA